MIHVIQSHDYSLYFLERLQLVFFALLVREGQMDTDVSFSVIHSFFCLCCQKHSVAEISFYSELLNRQWDANKKWRTNKKSRVLPRKFPFKSLEGTSPSIVSLKDLWEYLGYLQYANTQFMGPFYWLNRTITFKYHMVGILNVLKSTQPEMRQ